MANVDMGKLRDRMLLAKRGSLQSMGSGINRILRKLVGAGPSVRGLSPEKAEAMRKALMAGKVPTEKLRGPVSDLFGGLLSGAKGAGQSLRGVSPAQKHLLVNQLPKGVAKSPGRLYDAGFWQRLEDLYKQ